MPPPPFGPEGTHGWPVYIQGGTPNNPQFAYYPIPPGAAPPGTVPPLGNPRHRRRPARDDNDDDDQCTCPECVRPAAGKAAAAAGPTPTVPAQPTTFIPTQVFAPPPVHQQSTTFIPYVVPSCHCKDKDKSTSSCISHGHDHKKHTRKDSPSSSSYHYAASCDCPACKARRMAVEMDRIKEERRREREYQDAKDFFKMKERVDREDREAEFADEYRAAKKAAEIADDEARMYRRMMRDQEREAEYEWAAVPVPVPVPITAYHPGSSTPITLQPVNPVGYHSGWFDHGHHLAEENTKLRHERSYLKGEVQRERSLRNKEEATRVFFSTRLQDLDQDVQELKKKVRASRNSVPGQGSVIEIQVPTNKHHHSKDKKATVSAPLKDKGKKDKGGSSKEPVSPRRSSEGFSVKSKATGNSKHKQPHICHDSDCDDYDSCSDCSFECNKKGCRTCRPRGGRR
ncbi:hypothetical protein TWF696_001617 [Orbilia brochopaga]|uniref:Uncharacterized protein n=1 Tax=Orbilia brochopaga TaxID=3140254 RepID=A0AAV9U9Y2_9PEZI